jgi:predicted alpha/beta superfamily hydrolase
MRTQINFTLMFFFISALFISLHAQDYNLYNTQKKILISKSVGDAFDIYISLPDDYQDSDMSYPVLYVLDGDVAYGMATSIARYLQIGGNIPELIIVGIGYGTVDKSAGNERKRDYRPGETGDAENFLSFLNDELFPYIDSTYRTIPGERTIEGYSIGGLFALYSLFTKPETFNRYIVGSPYLLWDNSSIFNYEENSSEKIGDKVLNIFISVGSEESEEKYYNPIDSLVTKIQERNYPNVMIDTKVFDGSTHLTGPPEALTYGLISVFSK